MMPKIKKPLAITLCGLGVLAVFCTWYVRAHPMVFNESFFEHAHSWKIADGYLNQYALEHGGHFPYHTNGYADAVLLIPDVWLGCFSGPGYDTKAWEQSRRAGTHAEEAVCGRVYVQGLSVTNSSGIILLFDKIPSPGDHCHGFSRIHAPLVREVVKIGGVEIIPESDWPAVAKRQIELLVAAGISREQATSYYTQRPGQ